MASVGLRSTPYTPVGRTHLTDRLSWRYGEHPGSVPRHSTAIIVRRSRGRPVPRTPCGAGTVGDGGAGTVDVCERGDRLHGGPGGDRPGVGSADRGRRAARGAAGREPADAGLVVVASAVRAAVRGGVVHDGAARHDPGYPPLPRL